MNCKLLLLIGAVFSCSVAQSQVLHATDPNAPHSAANVVSLFGSGSCAGYLKSDGTCSTPSSGGTTFTEAHANSAAGTGTNLLASWSSSPDPHVTNTVATTATTSNNGTDANPEIVGVCISGCGTSGTGVFQIVGQVSWICDGTVTVGHYVQPSTSTAGQCHDAGAGADLSNENPEGNSFIGIVVTANTGSGTAAQIQLLPFPGYSNAIGGSNHWGQLVQAMGPGSGYLSATYWGQEPTTHALASDRPIHLYHFNNFYTDLEQTATLGTSGHDFLLDLLTHAPAWTNLPMFRINGSTYNVPNVQTVTGSVALNVSGTGGNYIWTLSGNTTLSAPTGDNAGHWLSFVIEPPTSGGPFTFTWPSIFKNAPTVSLSSGGTAIAAHCLFDGANYNCTGSSSGGGGGGVTSIATTSPITGGTITGTGTIACATCTVTIASGTSALGTSAISSAACATVVSTTATGTLTTDAISGSFNADPTAVTGYIPSTSGMLTIIGYPTADHVNWKVCNNTSASVTPGAITINWRVTR